MKRLLTIFCLLLFAITSWAEKVKIKLHQLGEKYEDDRSISVEPSASHDGNTIYLYSDIPLEKLQVTIKDGAGRIISSEVIPMFPQQPYSFSIGNVENGVYTLELYDGKEEYYGYFEITQ
jgi:hypothetical protein